MIRNLLSLSLIFFIIFGLALNSSAGVVVRGRDNPKDVFIRAEVSNNRFYIDMCSTGQCRPVGSPKGIPIQSMKELSSKAKWARFVILAMGAIVTAAISIVVLGIVFMLSPTLPGLIVMAGTGLIGGSLIFNHMGQAVWGEAVDREALATVIEMGAGSEYAEITVQDIFEYEQTLIWFINRHLGPEAAGKQNLSPLKP